MSGSLKSTTVRNVGYNSVAKIIQMAVMASATVILSRTLAPTDYGIVGFAGIFIAFMSQFSDLGINSAVIRKKELEQRELFTAFTIKFFIGLVIFILAYISAPLAVRFFDNPAIIWVIRLMAFNFVLSTIGFVPQILLIRKLDFKKIAMANLLPAILNSVVAVTLALLGFKYWSLVIALLVMTLCTGILLNIFQPVRHRFACDANVATYLMNFGGNVFLSGFITFLIFNADNFLIGSVNGATNLGYYSLAFNWGSMACTMIGGIVMSVLLPTFSRMQGDRERLKSSYLKVLQVISFGGVLINMTLFVVSRDFLTQVLGHNSDKWLPALTTLRILCFYGILRLLLEPVGQVVMALARTDVLRRATLLVAAIELIGLYPALHFLGIEGVALLVTVAYVSQYVLYYRLIRLELRISFRELYSSVGPALWGALFIGPVFLVGESGGSNSVSVLLLEIAGCVVIYLVSYGMMTKWFLYKNIISITRTFR